MRRLVAQLMVLIAVAVMAVPASADDAQIAKQIVARLNQQKQSANLQGFDLGVQVDKGTVTMMGQVASSEQAMLALDVARRIPGVKLVVNDLYVQQQAYRAASPSPSPAIQTVAAEGPVAIQQTAATAQPAQSVLAVGSAVAQPQMPVRQQPVAQPQVAQRPVPFAQSQIQRVAHHAVAPANYVEGGTVVGGGYGGAISENPGVPGYAWPSYAAAPNYGAVSYPQQYSATAWPYIGPFYPYPQVPLGWRKVSLEWDDGWWFLDFTKK